MSTKKIYPLLFIILVVAFACTTAHSLDEDSLKTSIQIKFGTVSGKPLFTYKLDRSDNNGITFELRESDKIVETGSTVYPTGFTGFIQDLIDGFRESTLKSIIGNQGDNNHMDLREMTIGIDKNGTNLSFQFQGSLERYGAFVRSSPTLEHALTAISKNRLKMYRLWEQPAY